MIDVIGDELLTSFDDSKNNIFIVLDENLFQS